MRLNSSEMQFSERAAPYIYKDGGKIGGLEYLRAQNPKLATAILPLQVVRYGEKLSRVCVPAGDDDRYIARGSSPFDFQGLVDVLDTKDGEARDLPRLVEELQKQAKRPAVLAYGQYEHLGFKGEIAVGIQPYLDGQRGSIVEHPNRPGVYVISFVPKDYVIGFDSITTGTYDVNTDEYKNISGSYQEIVGGYQDRPKRIVELYRLVEATGLAKPGLSLQLEFLNQEDEVYIAQVRAFMRKSQANFELDAEERLVFGTTPRKGIILPAYLSTNGFLNGHYPDYENPWAYLKFCEDGRRGVRNIFSNESEQDRTDRGLKFHPKRMVAYLIGQSFKSQVNTSLGHNHFRYAQKADLTIFEGDGDYRGNFTKLFYGEPHKKSPDLYESVEQLASMDWRSIGDTVDRYYGGKTPRKVKIICDGRTAIVEPVNPKGRPIFRKI